jgi:hypothetical protein
VRVAITVKDGRFRQVVRWEHGTEQPNPVLEGRRELRWTRFDAELLQEALLSDAFEVGSLEDGYREMADESLALAEESMTAAFEALPRD